MPRNFEIICNYVKLYENHLRILEIMWDHLELFENHVEICEIMSNHSTLFEIIWNHLQSFENQMPFVFHKPFFDSKIFIDEVFLKGVPSTK